MLTVTKSIQTPNDNLNLALEDHPSLPKNFLHRMVIAGGFAPSGDNLQPWAFEADGAALVVRQDLKSDQSLFNIRCLASFIALGGVLENIIIAASDEGYFAKINYFPAGQQDEVIARVTFEQGSPKDRLMPFIKERCTNRRSYTKTALSQHTLTALDVTKYYPRIGLSWIQDTVKLKALGKLISGADRLLFENSLIHKHFFSTIRWTAAEVERTRNGLPIASLELGRIGSIAFRCLKNWSLVRTLNHFGFSSAAAHHSIVLMRHCSAAGLLSTSDTSSLGFIEAGRAFQRLWLQATAEKLALQPMTSIIFLQLRLQLGDHNGLTSQQVTALAKLTERFNQFFEFSKCPIPAMLFRVGYAPDPTARTIRRYTADMIK